MATHSSTLAWRIPWTEELVDGLQSMGSQSQTRPSYSLSLTHTQAVGLEFPPPHPLPHVEAKQEAAPDVLLGQLPTSPRNVCLLPKEKRSL